MWTFPPSVSRLFYHLFGPENGRRQLRFWHHVFFNVTEYLDLLGSLHRLISVSIWVPKSNMTNL